MTSRVHINCGSCGMVHHAAAHKTDQGSNVFWSGQFSKRQLIQQPFFAMVLNKLLGHFCFCKSGRKYKCFYIVFSKRSGYTSSQRHHPALGSGIGQVFFRFSSEHSPARNIDEPSAFI